MSLRCQRDAGARALSANPCIHDRVLRTGLAELDDPDHPSHLHAADRRYRQAIDELITTGAAA